MKAFKFISILTCLALLLGNPMLAGSGALERNARAATAGVSRLTVFEYFSRDT